jgi:hypothetical protein
MDEVGEETMKQEEEKNEKRKKPHREVKNGVRDQECSHHEQKIYSQLEVQIPFCS